MLICNLISLRAQMLASEQLGMDCTDLTEDFKKLFIEWDKSTTTCEAADPCYTPETCTATTTVTCNFTVESGNEPVACPTIYLSFTIT